MTTAADSAQAQPLAQLAAFGYHEVTPEPLTSGFVRRGAVRYTLTPPAFARHLDRMAETVDRPRLVSEVNPADPVRRVLLTFDDGGRSAMAVADELDRRGWPGHFFIITERLGERSFLAPADVRELHARGHTVGSHSHTHPDIMRELPVAQLRAEWRRSVDTVELILGAPCLTGAVPGGHTSADVERTAAESGLRYLFTCTPTTRPRRVDECWVLGRVLVRRTTSARTIASLARFRGWERARLVRDGKDVMRLGAPWLFRAWVRLMKQEPLPEA